MLQVALDHVRYGFPIVALRPRDKAPAEVGWQSVELDEAAVDATARDISRLLWRLGYRRAK